MTFLSPYDTPSWCENQKSVRSYVFALEIDGVPAWEGVGNGNECVEKSSLISEVVLDVKSVKASYDGRGRS